MVDKEKIQIRKEEIEKLLDSFFVKNLNDDLKEYCIKLLDKLSRKRTYTIERGKIEICASAIVCVIARLNFLFDKQNKNYISLESICTYFGTKSRTTGNKATEIEKACKIGFGSKEFCNSEISDSLSFVQLSNGMIVFRCRAYYFGAVRMHYHYGQIVMYFFEDQIQVI